jgi:hypothetical protein
VDDTGTFWTLQQFTVICGKPWYALQRQNDEGVLWQYTGYRHEVDAFCRKHGVTPQELPPTTEEEFFRRSMGELPEDPATLKPGRATWEPKT